MTDKITNWYAEVDKNKSFDIDDNFEKHYILPCSRIICVGASGTGKTTAFMELLKRKNNSFTQIIIYSGSGVDEPLYDYLKTRIPETQLINDINDLPELESFDREKEKIIVFDDWVVLPKNQIKKIEKYFIASRKYGFTVFCMAQTYTSIPKIISRNAEYLFIFKQNDNISINTIIKNHSLEGINSAKFKEYYNCATKEKGNFLLIDMKTSDKKLKLRRNFLDFFKT